MSRGKDTGRTSLGHVESRFSDKGVSCGSLALLLLRGLVGTAALCQQHGQDLCPWRFSHWKGLWGRKHTFPATLLGSWLRPPCNRRQVNRREINRSLITCILSVYMGEPQEKRNGSNHHLKSLLQLKTKEDAGGGRYGRAVHGGAVLGKAQ